MKIWDKGGVETAEAVLKFTIGQDRTLDVLLAPFDVLGSIAHVKMLAKVDLISKAELSKILPALIQMHAEVSKPNFKIVAPAEDIHSTVEGKLIEQLGAIGGKIHTGRSRNDQVLVDLSMFYRSEIKRLIFKAQNLFQLFNLKAREWEKVIMPGYTHQQVGMPSSFGLWISAFSELLLNDLESLKFAHAYCNQCPLGSGAGYGSPFPLDRQFVSDLLGFERPVLNSIAAQARRSKMDQIVMQSIGHLAFTLNRLANDMCLFFGQNFGFIKIPSEFTTGSSIMPHKKNPDVWELVRSKSGIIKGQFHVLESMQHNLPTGYYRDYQLAKTIVLPSFNELSELFDMCYMMVEGTQVHTELANDPKYADMYSVNAIKQLVDSGVPFREAYQRIGNGEWNPSSEVFNWSDYTHIGSIGNLQITELEAFWQNTIAGIPCLNWEVQFEALLKFE